MPTLTALMGLAKPTGGSGGDVDTWGTIYLNGDMDLLDAHDHTTGKGAPVKSAALRWDSDVQANYGGSYFALLQARALGLKPVAASSVAMDANVLYVDSGASNNLYFKNQGGAAVRITSGNNLDITLVGGIVGDYAAVNAEVAFDDGLDTFTFKQQGSPRPWAKMRCGDIDLYEAAATIANRIRLRSPAALAASYELVMPAALPGSQSLLHVSSAGQLLASNSLANNASLTLSGTGEIKHGDRVIHVHSAAFHAAGNNAIGTPSNVSSGGVGFEGAAWSAWAASPNNAIAAGIPLRVGDRIKTIDWYLLKASNATAMTMQLRAATMPGGVYSTVDSVSDTSAGAAVITNTRTGINYTLVSGDSPYLQVKATVAAQEFYGCRITYDHP